MNHKIRSTVTGILVAMSFVTASSFLGDAPTNMNTSNTADSSLETSENSVTDVGNADSRDQRVRRYISMPYFSFGNVFPK
jgi:hypothetical protein